MVKTGKVTNAINEDNQTIVNVDFMDNTKATIVLPLTDSKKYKDKYVICGIDSDENTNIIEIVDDGPS
ncbi:MAG: hypothetical protein K0R78_534 [Pelosinus sp.]|nr:hypothetical protein [Pelosinus sp.]